MSGPLLTQPLNIDGQGVIVEGQDRYLIVLICQFVRSTIYKTGFFPFRTLTSQSGAQTQLPPMIDPNFMQNAQPAFFTHPQGYWHPQPLIIPPYGAPPAPPSYVPAQQAWTTTTSSKDSSVTRVQPTQPSTGVTGSAAMTPIMPLDQQYEIGRAHV